MRKLSVLDLAFFVFETKSSPKHVAGLMKCKKPRNSAANYVPGILQELRSLDAVVEPFDLVINMLGWKGPQWKRFDDFSLDDHLFYHRSKKAMNWLEVEDLVARLHEPMMDRSKPLWEFHLIDGIRGGYFAIYTKLHHAYADGMTMNSWFKESFADSPEDMSMRPIWALQRSEPKPDRDPSSFLSRTVRSMKHQAWDQVMATGGIAKLSAQLYLEGIGITRNAVSLPFSASRETPLTGSASPGRSLATTSLPMSRVRKLCKATRSTLNHVALACIDGALHQYLEDSGVSLDHPITIQMPVNLRRDGDDRAGNKLGIVLVELAQPTDDPYVRLREIGFKLRKVRNQIDGVPGTSIEQFSILAAATGELIEKLNLSDTLPAHGHTLVSNVPGPVNPLYIKGARVEQMYPISTLAPGLHMNITLFSYAGLLQFGIVSTHDLKQLDKLARCIEQAFEDLENSILESA